MSSSEQHHVVIPVLISLLKNEETEEPWLLSRRLDYVDDKHAEKDDSGDESRFLLATYNLPLSLFPFTVFSAGVSTGYSSTTTMTPSSSYYFLPPPGASTSFFQISSTLAVSTVLVSSTSTATTTTTPSSSRCRPPLGLRRVPR